MSAKSGLMVVQESTRPAAREANPVPDLRQRSRYLLY